MERKGERSIKENLFFCWCFVCLLRLRRGVTSVIFLASWKTLLPKSPPHANERSSVPLFGVLVAKVKTSVHCFQFTRTYTTTTTLANEKVQDSFFFSFIAYCPSAPTRIVRLSSQTGAPCFAFAHPSLRRYHPKLPSPCPTTCSR